MASPRGGKSVFLIRALERILTEKEVKRNQHLQLRKACESALSESTSCSDFRTLFVSTINNNYYGTHNLGSAIPN